MFIYFNKYVKKSMILRKSAEIKKYSTISIISQRLESRDFIFPYLVGLIEGDGWFTISKKGKYIMYELGIELSIKDVQLLYKIKSILGIGTISFRYRNRSKIDNHLEKNDNMVIYRIRDKFHLKNVIIPIFDSYPLLSSKQFDYIRFRSCLLGGIIFSKDLLSYTRPNIPVNSVKSIMNTSYFSSWLIGFIEAESCFSIYKPTNDSSFIASFEISQTDEEVLIVAIHKYLKLTGSITVSFRNNIRFKVSSVRNIENIINFMERAPIKLLGYKKLQYLLWLKKLRMISRYNTKINIPKKY